jgi:glycosidase
MVLRALPILVVAAGCLPQVPVARLVAPTRVAVAMVVDFDDQVAVAEVPPGLSERLQTALGIRNLVPRQVPFADYAPSFATTRDTLRRLARVAELSEGAPLVLLVETKAQFFSQLNGRYKWTVVTRVTLLDPHAPDRAQTTDLDYPAILDFDHEREPAALLAVATLVADKIGILVDRFLAGHDGFPQAPVATISHSSASPLANLAPIYFVLVDRFANGDPTNDGDADVKDPAGWHGGDLRGITRHLDELQSLGVRTLWLSPVFQSRHAKFFAHGAFHGYWTEDLRRLDPRFGTEADLADLAAGLERRGMKLVLDLVLNHVGYEAPLLTERPSWFHGRGTIENWEDPEELVTHDVHGLPDLAQENEEVYRYLLEASTRWIAKVKPAGFRLDAVKHVATPFWTRYNADLRAVAGRDFVTIGEIFEGAPWRLADAQRAGGFSAVFDFPLHYALKDVFCSDLPLGRLAATFTADREYDDPRSLVTFLDNHDLPRILSACHEELPRVLQALTVLLTARGTPSIMYGTEAGLLGTTEPDNRADMRFDASSPTARVLTERIRRLFAARREHAVLNDGATRIADLGADMLVLYRSSDTETALIAVNQGGAARSVALPLGPANARITDVLRSDTYEQGTLVVPAHDVAVLLFEPKTEADRRTLHRLTGASTTRRAVRFEIRNAPTAAGQELFVAGLGPELGNWQPESALGPLARSGERQTGEVLLPVDAVFEYKLVARRGVEISWERTGNRYLFVTPGDGPLRVELSWGQPESRAS